MNERIGERERFAFEVHPLDVQHSAMRRVDLWLGARLLTEDDNTVYVPQFRHSIQHDLDELLLTRRFLPPADNTMPVVDQFDLLHQVDDGRSEEFWFAHWGPTTDRVSVLLFRIDDRAVLVARQTDERGGLLPGEVIEVDMTVVELTALLQAAIVALAD